MSSSNGTITHTATSASDRTGTINALPYTSTGYTEQDFKEDTSTTNTWGYTLVSSNLPESGNNKYYSIYNGTDYIANINNNTTPVNSDITTMSYATKVDDTLPAGSYTTTITFIATTNQNPHFMQDIASWKNELTEPGQSIKAVDIRDNKTYWVTKLETDPNIPEDLPGDNLPSSAGKRADCETIDGTRHCYQIWMTQNLDLAFTGTRTYTYYDTDLGHTTGETDIIWTPDKTMTDINGFDTDSTGGNGYCAGSDCSYEYGDIYFYTSDSDSDDVSYDSLTSCIIDGHTEDDCLHYKAGNLYNFYTSAALGAEKNGVQVPHNTSYYAQMENSLCPAGWRLPVGNTSLGKNDDLAANPINSNWSDFGYLLKQNEVTPHSPLPDYSITNTSISPYGNDSKNVGYNINGLNKLRGAPLYFVRSGRALAGNIGFQAQDADYWSGTIGGAYLGSVSILSAYTSIIYPSNNRGIATGFSVRCIAR